MRGIEQHYEALLPAETEEMKECERLAQATEARIKKMRYEAVLRGQVLRFNARYYLEEAAQHFQAPDIQMKPNLPRIKRSQLEPLKLLEKQRGQR